MKILVYFDFTDEQIEGLRAVVPDAEVVHAKTEEDAVRLTGDAEVLLGHFPKSVFEAASRLRWIQSFSAGLDKFLFPEVIESDVTLTNMAGVYASQGAEHAWALLLALTRGIPHFVRHQDRREWKSTKAVELRGGVLGIIGLGGFGTEMAKRAIGYDMAVIALDPVRTDRPEHVAELKPLTRETLYDLLGRSDAVMLGCPKTPETIDLIDADALRAMKPTAFLINVTRGSIINEDALLHALRDGEIAGAGLDVFDQEPLPVDSPLWDLENLIITTHLAGQSQHRPRMTFEFFRENLRRYAAGEPLLNVVDKRRGF